MRVTKFTRCLLAGSLLFCVTAYTAKGATQGNLAGTWTGTAIFTFKDFPPPTTSSVPLTFSIDSLGNISGTIPGPFPITLGGTLTVTDPVTGTLSGTFIDSFTYNAQADVKISSPGQNGQPFRITGTFIDPANVAGDGFTLDVSGGSLPPVIISPAAAGGNVGIQFLFAPTATGTKPLTISVSGTLPPGLVFSGGQISGMPTTAGITTVTVTATNSVGSVNQTLTINIGAAIPPAFTSPGFLNVSAFQNFSTPLAAYGSQPITFTVGSMPAGVGFSLGYIINGKIVVPGTYSVLITATNAAGSVQQTLIVNVTPLDPNGSINGDGVPNGIAVKLGLDPSDPTQTPFDGLSAIGVTRLSLSKMSIKLKNGADTISLTGSLPTLDRYSVANQRVTILIGDIVQSAQLSKSGAGTATGSSGALKVRIAGGGKGPGTHNAPFTITMKGNYAALLAASGFDPKSDSMFPVTILFSRTVFTINVAYSAATKSFASTQ